MKNITIFTADFADENMSEILKLTQVGNLAPIILNGVASGTEYKSAPATPWDEETTYIPDESTHEIISESEEPLFETLMEKEDRIISGLVAAFADLVAGTIEAITLSIPLFLTMQQRPEFSPDSTVTIFLKSFESESMGTIAPVSLTGTMDYKITLNSEWTGNIYEPDLSKSDAEVTTGLLSAFGDLMAGTIDAIRMPVAIFLLVQARPEFN